MVEKILGTGTLSMKGQTTIPKNAREKFELKPGDIIAFLEKDGNLVIRKG